MNSPKDTVAAVRDGMNVILGASGNTGSLIANFLLSRGQKVRVVGRDVGRLQRFVRKGAEALTAEMTDAAALSKAFPAVRAQHTCCCHPSPPAKTRSDRAMRSRKP